MCRFIKISFLVFISFIFSFGLNGQSVSIKTQLDTHRVELGARAQLSYIIEKDHGQIILLPYPGDTLTSAIELAGTPWVDSIKLSDDRMRLTQSMLITSFEEGNQYIPSQPFGIKNGDRIDTILSSASYLEVVGVALDTTGVIRDIANIERAPIILRDFLPLLFILIIVLIALAIVYVIKRRKQNKGLFSLPEKPADPPYIVALRELDRLKAQKLWQQQQTKEYYSRLTNVIRVFMEDSYGILAMEKPSSEIIKELKSFNVKEVFDISILQELLNLADLIKFAKGEADPEENMRHLDNAYNIVKAVQASVEAQQDDNNTKEEIKE